jgi:predicted transcriptional regulator
MVEKTRTIDLSFSEEGSSLNFFFQKKQKTLFDLESLSLLRKVFSKERIRLIDVIKKEQPQSIYHLTKLAHRDFKAVFKDVKLLEKFGFIDLKKEKTGSKIKLRPIIAVDSLIIRIKI